MRIHNFFNALGLSFPYCPVRSRPSLSPVFLPPPASSRRVPLVFFRRTHGQKRPASLRQKCGGRRSICRSQLKQVSPHGSERYTSPLPLLYGLSHRLNNKCREWATPNASGRRCARLRMHFAAVQSFSLRRAAGPPSLSRLALAPSPLSLFSLSSSPLFSLSLRSPGWMRRAYEIVELVPHPPRAVDIVETIRCESAHQKNEALFFFSTNSPPPPASPLLHLLFFGFASPPRAY